MALKKIGALWKMTSKKGAKYLSGEINFPREQRIVVFKNSFKKNEKEPDYLIYIDEEDAKDVPPYLHVDQLTKEVPF